MVMSDMLLNDWSELMRSTLLLAATTVLVLSPSANAANLLIHYGFDDGAAAATNQGSLGDGTRNGTTYSGTAAIGSQSLSFDGDNDWITNPDLGSRTAFTTSFWYNTPGAGGGAALYTNGAWTNDSVHSNLSGTNGSSRMWMEFNSGNQRSSGDVAGGTQLNNWHNIIASFESGSITYYVDGVQSPAGSQTMSGPTARFDVSQIGAWNDSRDYNGLYDDWSFWDAGLSAAEAVSLYNLGTSSLDYNASDASELFDVFNGDAASANINGLVWTAAADGALVGGVGEVVDLGGGDYGLVLNANGGGLTTLSAAAGVPEPTSLVIWSLLGLLTMGFRRSRPRNV